MSTYKKIILTFFIFIFFSASNVLFGQTKERKQTNSEYVMELIQNSTTTSVYIVAVNDYKEYKKEWLSNISIKGEFIIFRAGRSIHTWDISNAIWIQKDGSVIKVKLSDVIGR